MMSRATRSFSLATLAALVLAFTAGMADARVGGGFSTGNRGLRTFTPPAVTRTAPTAAAPITRTNPGAAATAPGVAAGSRGWGSGLMGGLLGAGLFGLLLGYGIFNIGSFAGALGLILQVALVGGLIWLFMSWRRNAAATAGNAPGMGNLASANVGPGSGFGFGGNGAAQPASPPRMLPPLQVAQPDLETFESMLVQSQDAYGRGDVAKLRALATPEMVNFFESDLRANDAKGVRDEVSGAKLLQGDLAEAWRERNFEFATVAMRYSLRDAMVETATGKVVSGSRDEPQEVTEIWTFVRPAGGTMAQWRISAIQQTA